MVKTGSKSYLETRVSQVVHGVQKGVSALHMNKL